MHCWSIVTNNASGVSPVADIERGGQDLAAVGLLVVVAGRRAAGGAELDDRRVAETLADEGFEGVDILLHLRDLFLQSDELRRRNCLLGPACRRGIEANSHSGCDGEREETLHGFPSFERGPPCVPRVSMFPNTCSAELPLRLSYRGTGSCFAARSQPHSRSLRSSLRLPARRRCAGKRSCRASSTR